MEKIDVVFLDFDGVINTPMLTEANMRRGHAYNHEEDRKVNNYRAICYLNELCHLEKLKIVVSSTWRMADKQYPVAKALYNSGLDLDIEVIGCTPILHQDRGIEIKNFLVSHPQIDRFVILDDDSDMADLIDYLVLCNHEVGFGAPEFLVAIKLLDEKFDEKNDYTVDEDHYNLITSNIEQAVDINHDNYKRLLLK